MATISNPNPSPNPSPNSTSTHPSPNPNPYPHPISAQTTPNSVEFKGVWLKNRNKKGGGEPRYAAEIAHRTITTVNRKIWLGTYPTAEEAALAYDLAAIRIKGTAPNLSVGANGEIHSSLAPEIQDLIRRKVEELITGQFRSGDGTNQEVRRRAKRKKKADEGSARASTSGSGARKRDRGAKKQELTEEK